MTGLYEKISAEDIFAAPTLSSAVRLHTEGNEHTTEIDLKPQDRESDMTATRRAFISASALAVLLPQLRVVHAADAKTADFLFVQSAESMTFDRATNKLMLEGVSPITVMFTDRPERIASHMRTAKFVPFWSQGKDSFLSDPPNADVSIIEGDKLKQVIVTLMDPKLEGDNLSYTVKILEGDMPAKGADVSVFIDIIGMPLTPLSFAGARWRAWRRAVWY
jgi:hypothetical protein